MILSIVIPTFNEEKRLPATLAAVKDYFRMKRIRPEIIVADDGSTDRTALVAKRARVKVLELTHSGKGSAVKAGVLAARGAWILVADADNSVPIETFDRLWVKRDHPIVIASRFLEESRLRSQTPLRIILSKLANIGARLILGLPFADTQCGFKLYRSKEAKEIFGKVTVPGFGFDLEVLTVAQGLGIPVAEVPVRWRDARGSRLRALRSLLAAGFEFLSIVWNLERGRYGALPHENPTTRQFVKFALVGSSNVAVDFAVLNVLVQTWHVPVLIAGTVSILAAIVNSFIWNSLWTFRGQAKTRPLAKRFTQFLLVQSVGDGFNWLVFAAVITLFGLHYNLAKVLAIAASTIWNFTGNKWWVFRR